MNNQVGMSDLGTDDFVHVVLIFTEWGGREMMGIVEATCPWEEVIDLAQSTSAEPEDLVTALRDAFHLNYLNTDPERLGSILFAYLGRTNAFRFMAEHRPPQTSSVWIKLISNKALPAPNCISRIVCSWTRDQSEGMLAKLRGKRLSSGEYALYVADSRDKHITCGRTRLQNPKLLNTTDPIGTGNVSLPTGAGKKKWWLPRSS